MKTGEELINAVKRLILKGKTLTILEMQTSGITKYNIKWLCENGYIERTSRGIYAMKERKIDQHDRVYKLILQSIQNSDFENAKNYLYILHEISKNVEDTTILMRLLDYISHLDEEHKNIITAYNKEKFEGKKYENSPINYLYKKIFVGDFIQANDIFNTSLACRKTEYAEILGLLININKTRVIECNERLVILLYERDIEGINAFLRKESETHTLTKRLKAMLYLSQIYLDALKTGNFPEKKELNVKITSLFLFIGVNDFETAYQTISNQNDTLKTMLNEILMLKKEIEEKGQLPYYKYKIEDLERIVWLESTSIRNIDETIVAYGMTPDDASIYRLLYAKEAYCNNLKALADKLVRLVEKTKNKSERVKRLMIELRNKKALYINSKKYAITKLD